MGGGGDLILNPFFTRDFPACSPDFVFISLYGVVFVYTTYPFSY
jgi:hypothetical protein